MSMIFHIIRRAEWRSVRHGEVYAPDSLADEGFIHCSTASQVAASAGRHFPGDAALLVLCIDTSRLRVPLVHEDTAGRGEIFPHIYGPVNLDAVVDIRPLTRADDGRVLSHAG